MFSASNDSTVWAKIAMIISLKMKSEISRESYLLCQKQKRVSKGSRFFGEEIRCTEISLFVGKATAALILCQRFSFSSVKDSGNVTAKPLEQFYRKVEFIAVNVRQSFKNLFFSECCHLKTTPWSFKKQFRQTLQNFSARKAENFHSSYGTDKKR